MPIYKLNGDTYNIPDDVVSRFESDHPEATVRYKTKEGYYNIPVKHRDGFLKKYPDAEVYNGKNSQKEDITQGKTSTETNPFDQPLHVEVPESIRSANGLSGSNTTSAYTLPETIIKRPKTTENEPEDDRLFEENMQRMKEGKPLNRVTTQSVIDANPDLGLQGSSYQPTEEEIRSYTLRNKPGMFKNRTSSLIDKPLGDAAESVEGYGDKANARVDLLKKYYSGDEFKQRIKKETGARVTDLLEQTDADLNTINEKISAHQKAMRNENWRPGMPSSRDDNTLVELRRQRTLLNNAENILDDSRKIVDEAGKKDSSWYESLGRGVRDKVFDVDSWTMGITDMAGSMNLNKVLEKADREEELDPAEQRLLDAAVTNMAVNAYYSSDLSAAYKAGQVTGESIPFMLEMAINPVSASGNATAKLLLKYGLKKMSKQLGKNVGRTIGAAAGITATTGLPGVIGGGYDRMSGQVQFALDNKGRLSYAGREGDMGAVESFGKSAASRFLENHSEMVFNAFKGLGDVVWRGVEKVVPGGVNSFIQKAADTGAGRMFRELGNNELMKEAAKRTQFHGIVGEYLEEVYNNLANVSLGEMTMEQVTDLDRNIDTFLGLAPTSVFFGLLGLGSMSAERIQHRRKMDSAFGNMNEVQRKKLAELERMSKENGNADIRTFIKETMADPGLTKEQKRQEIEYAYDIAVNNAFDEVADEQAKEQGEFRAEAQEEGQAVYESGDPAAIRESVVREEVSRGMLEEVYPDVETIARLMQADDAGRAEILDEMPEEVRDRAMTFLRDYDRHQSVEDAINEAHVPEVEAAQARVEEMTRHGRVTMIPLGRFADETHKFGIVVNGLDEAGNTTGNGSFVMVVPIKEGANGPDFSTFDMGKAEVVSLDPSVQRQEMDPVSIIESMLESYQADVDKLSQTPVAAGQTYSVLDSSGRSKNIQIQGQDAQGNWVVAVEGQKNPSVMPEENLLEMLAEAERAPVVAAYAAEEQAKTDAKSAAQKEIMSDKFSPEVISLQPEPGEEIEVNGRRASVMGVTPDGINVRYLTEGGMTAGSGIISMEDYYTHKQALFDSSQTNQEPVQEEQVIAEEKQTEPAIPVKDDGSVDYVSYGSDNALKLLGEKYGEKMPHKVAVTAEAYKADLAKMQKKLDKAAEDYDNVPIGREAKAEAALKKVSQEYEALKRESDFWSALEAEIKAAQEKPGETVAEEILSMEEPLTGEEFAAQMLANGNIKLLRESFVNETGFGNDEAKSYLGLFASVDKGGLTIQEAGEKLMEADRENGTGFYDQNDPNAGRNAILEVLGLAKTRGDLAGFIKKNRSEQAKKEQDAEYAAYESWVEENFHMSVEEFEAYEEVIARDLAERALSESEYNEFMSIFVDETVNNVIYGQQGIDSESETGSEVLPGTEPLQTERAGRTEKESSEIDVNIVGQNGTVSEGTSGSELASRIEAARSEVNASPSEAQKEAGNYKMGHVRIDGYDITIENPKGSVRSGVDKGGKSWTITMNNDYGYIRGTEAVDGDHIDVFLSDTPDSGRVFVVDQKNEDGSFDESKVMYGFDSLEEARNAYLSNYNAGWESRIMAITEVSKEDFKKWIDSSRRKTKAFSEYKSVKQESAKQLNNPLAKRQDETGYEYALRMAEEKRRIPLRSRANEWAKVLGVKVNFIEKREDVKNKVVFAAIERGQKVTGWFDLGNGEVYFYMPNLDNMSEVDNTYVHEVVSHKGLPQLLGKKRFDELCDKVWNMMPQSAKDVFINYPGVNGNTRIAADEYIAHLAEQESLSPDEKSVWDEIVKLVRDMLDKVLNSIVGKSEITDKDISKLIKASYANLKFGAAENVEGESTRLRTSRKIEKLFDDAVAGNLTGKPVSIGKLTSEGKDYLERISGLKLKSDIDFVLNPSDLVHIYRDHYETNEKDTGKNVPLTKNDIRRLVDVISFPNKVVFGIEEGSNRKLFYFLMDSAGGTYNLLEVYADRKGNLTTKTYYKTKKDAAQRVMELENSLLPTSETYSGAILSDTKIPKIFEPTNDSSEKSRFRVVYHGSGSEFDKFSHEKMGTGAGSQAFGWGTYVTESTDIAKDYANISAANKLFDDENNFELVKSMPPKEVAAMMIKREMDNNGKTLELAKEYVANNFEGTAEDEEFDNETREFAHKLSIECKDVTEEDLNNVALGRHLYEVEIPDEKRGNYIVWGNNVTDASAKKVLDGIYDQLIATEEYDTPTAQKELRKELDNLKDAYGQGKSGIWKDLYGDVSSYLGSDKDASLFLHSLGYVGIKYPAGTIYKGNYGGAHNYVIFDENDLRIVEHTRFRVYKSKDGKETKYKQLSLFDEGIKAVNDGGGSYNIQREETSTIESLNRLRELQEGEICNVERRFTESKEFSFTRGEKIESAADVAYIFKSLEDEAIENSFVAVTNGDNVTVLHLGMGAQTQTVADTTAIFAAVERLGADKIFFVHNHPTGNVKCSRQDVQTYQALKDTFGDKLQDGIIINTRSGKYGLFNSSGLVDDEGRIKEEKDEYPISVYKFNKQAFNVDEIPSISPSSDGIAEFVSTQRLGKRDKINALLLNNNFGCVGNILIDNSKNTKAIVEKIANDAIAMSARQVVIYGRYPFVEVTDRRTNFVSYLSDAVNRYSQGNVRLLDIIQIDEPYSKSANDEGVRFRVTNKNQEIFVSNAAKAVEGIKQEKATPQQWLAMIEKNGGLKAGEDKWLGLSDWLKESTAKTLAKDEVLDFINQNKIVIEEVHYAGKTQKALWEEFKSSEKGATVVNGQFYEDAYEWADMRTRRKAGMSEEDYEEAWSKNVDEYLGGKSSKENREQAERTARSRWEDGEFGVFPKSINYTRIDYTTGGLKNNNEIALVVPTIDSWNEYDEVHFGDAGYGRAIAWIRFGETTIESKEVADKVKVLGSDKWWNMSADQQRSIMKDIQELKANNKSTRILVIDEIQSKRHQEGREKGYYNNEANKKWEKYREYLSEKYPKGWNPSVITPEEFDELKRLNSEVNAEKKAANGKIPEAPFEKNWSELAMKRMLRYAAENGFDKVAWTKGAQQAERYNLSKVVDSIECNRNGKNGNKSFVLRGLDYNVVSNNEGLVVAGTEEFKGKQLSEVVGSSLAKKMLEMEEGDVIDTSGLRVGGEGMKGFYDKMLPSFVNKYVKKWGTKVQDIELPNVEEAGRIMHSVDVTDAMKESVMEGQVMFRISEKGKKIQAELDKFTAKYNSKPVVIVDSEMTDEKLEEAIPESSAERTREEISSGYPGGYSPNTDKIYIFVDNQEMDDIEDTMFHENLHSLYNGSSMVEEFYNNAKEDKKTLIEALSEAYKGSEIPNEMFAHMIAKDMFKGDFKFAEKYLSEESRNGLFNTLKEFGYDRLEEESLRRRQGAVQRNVQMDREPQKAESVDGGLHEGKAISPRERKEQLGKLFDKVADMGLRGVLGDAEYDLLMRDIYNVLPKDVRSKIKDDAQEHYGGDFVPAMSDYLNIKGKSFVWDKVVGVIKEVLRRAGFDLSLTESDVKYLIWRNRRPLNPYSIIEKAEDIHKLFTLKVDPYSDESSKVRFREKRPAIVQEYDKVIDSSSFRFQEAFQDSMLSLKVLMEIIEKETGKKAKSFENAYSAENRLSSINKVDNEKYLESFFNPLMTEIKILSDKVGQQAVEDYIYAKSGLERNEVLKQRDADKVYAESMEELDEKLRKGELSDDQYDALKTNAEIARGEAMAKEDDYAGLRGLLFNSKARELEEKLSRSEISKDEYSALFTQLEENAEDVEKDFKEFAEKIVSDFESEVGEDAVNSLWGKINAATNETLRKDYESGMLDKESYEGTKNMMKYYVPLRGWSEKTAEDVYDYYYTTAPIQRNQKKAGGRRSQADNPISYIAQMAQNAIVRGNRNKMKQRLFNFVVNRPTALATFQEGWYVKNNASKAFELEYPEIEEGDTAEDIQQKMDEFEKRMEELAKEKLAFKGKLPFGSPYRIKAKQKNEHVVPVMINGREYGIYINGNPRAAQAVNGMTNPEASNMMSEMYESVKRFYSAGLTSWNPDFLMANAVRDSIHSVTMTYLDKGPLAAAYYLRNIPSSLRTVAAEIFGKGTADPTMHQYFEEFVNYGGETGYTAIHTLEDYKKEYEKILKELSSLEKAVQDVKGGFSAMAKWMEQANRIFEDVNRFNAYQAARRSGLGIEESVDAAKNITVNFNKKGALGTTKGFWGSIAGVMSKWILFFNPTVQGITQIYRSRKMHPKRFNALLGAVFGSGLIVPFLNSMVFGMFGGDEEDYWLQNDYNRMNNLLLKNPFESGYFKIPLPPTFREIYGMGDILYRLMTDRITPERAAIATLRQLQLLTGFLNLIPDEEPDLGKALIGLAPDVLAPLTDVILNQDFTGRKIAKVSDYNKHDPEYLRVYKGVSPFYVEVSRYINEMGGDDISRAPLYGTFINPAYMEHVITGYSGGIGKTLSNVAGIVADAVSGEFYENFDLRKVPIVSRFYSVSDEATVKSAVNRKYRDYQSRYEKLKHDYKKYKAAVSEGELQFADELSQMDSSGEKEFVDYFGRKQKLLNKKLDRLKKNPDNKALEQEITDLKAEISLKCFELLK